MIGMLAIIVLWALFCALGVHHFWMALKGLRTGVVRGLLLGYRQSYSRESEPTAYWVNVSAGIVAAVLAALVFIWGVLWVTMLFEAYQGRPTL